MECHGKVRLLEPKFPVLSSFLLGTHACFPPLVMLLQRQNGLRCIVGLYLPCTRDGAGS